VSTEIQRVPKRIIGHLFLGFFLCSQDNHRAAKNTFTLSPGKCHEFEYRTRHLIVAKNGTLHWIPNPQSFKALACPGTTP
jgi:hypothetical protein